MITIANPVRSVPSSIVLFLIKKMHYFSFYLSFAFKKTNHLIKYGIVWYWPKILIILGTTCLKFMEKLYIAPELCVCDRERGRRVTNYMNETI